MSERKIGDIVELRFLGVADCFALANGQRGIVTASWIGDRGPDFTAWLMEDGKDNQASAPKRLVTFIGKGCIQTCVTWPDEGQTTFDGIRGAPT